MTFAISSSDPQTFDNRQHLLVMDLVAQLRWIDLLGVEGDRMEEVVGIALGNDTTESEVRSIGLDDDGKGGVETSEDRSGGERCLESVECLESCTIKVKDGIFSEKSSKGAGDL